MTSEGYEHRQANMEILDSRELTMQETSPTSHESRFVSFLDKHSPLICLCLIALACLRIVSTYNALSLTPDEPVHFACGLEYVAKHVYVFETQHPPLSRAMVALGPYLAGARPAGFQIAEDEGYAAIARSGNVDRTIFLMRLGNLPFFLLACLVVYRWSIEAFSKSTAVLAVGLFTMLPSLLADAGLATTDMALAATVGAAFLATLLWAGNPTLWRSVALGFFVGLACLSKFTALGYLPLSVCFSLAIYLATHWPGWIPLRRMAIQRLPMFALAAAIALFLIWAGYWFSTGDARLPHTQPIVRIPAPEFLDGIRSALKHNRSGHTAFLLGEVRKSGWWYYFPVALLVKTPIPFLILLALGIFVSLRKWKSISYLLPIAFSLAILLPAMQGHIDIGIRHIEPIYIGLSITAAIGMEQLLRWSSTRTVFSFATAVLAAWMVLSGATHHPDYLTYFNEFAMKNPDSVLVDSNYDWGQDFRLLARRLHQLGATRFSLVLSWKQKRDPYLEQWYGLPAIERANDFVPAPGWTVVSPTYDKSFKFNSYPPGTICWYDRIPPTERVGALRLYYVPDRTETAHPTSR
jgi:hypothetical protein